MQELITDDIAVVHVIAAAVATIQVIEREDMDGNKDKVVAFTIKDKIVATVPTSFEEVPEMNMILDFPEELAKIVEKNGTI
jgi:hypothetical protein